MAHRTAQSVSPIRPRSLRFMMPASTPRGFRLALSSLHVVHRVVMAPPESIPVPETSEAIKPLTQEEEIRWRQLEQVIEKSLASFLTVGRCLLEVRNRKLYRTQYGSWRDYLLRRWALSESRGLELCRATEVVDLLTGPGGPGAPDGDAPVPSDVSPAVLRPLTKLRPDLQRECWRL